MLDPWIIEEIRRREEERQDSRLPATVEIPLHGPRPNGVNEQQQKRPDDSPPRGIEIIDFHYPDSDQGVRYTW
jgi:hypothetical protein